MNSFSFAPIFGDGMVLQRDKEITVWGYGADGKTIKVSLGNISTSCTAQNNKWHCKLPPQTAAAGLTLRAVQDNVSIELRDVMLGDIWVAAGQSNMEFFLRYEKHWQKARRLAENRQIRMYTCPRIAFKGQEPLQSGGGVWFGEENDALETFSSIGYWFARELQPKIDVPVGILSCNWGGTSASAWMPETELLNEPLNVYFTDYQKAVMGQSEEEIYNKSMQGWAYQKSAEHLTDWDRVMLGISKEAQAERLVRCANNPVIPMGPFNKNRPGCLYDMMVSEILPFAVKGVLWYQGESDIHHADLYSTLLSRMIGSWRKSWGEDLPFLLVQLAPFERWMALDGDCFPKIRHQQDIVSKTVPHCWMTSTMDIGMQYDIHPKEKAIIGRRLALLSLCKVYGHLCLGEPPEALTAGRLENGEIFVLFTNCGDGMYATNSVGELFRVFQDGREKSVSDFKVEKERIIFKCNDLSETSAVISFAELPFECVELYNSAAIPAKPFSLVLERTV